MNIKNFYTPNKYADPKYFGKYYVYEYIEDEKPFYIGKGSNNRIDSHLVEAKGLLKKNVDPKTHKLRKITKILKNGGEPKRIKVIEGLSDSFAYYIEEVLISFYGLENLTNIVYARGGDTISKNPNRELICNKISKTMIERGTSARGNNPCYNKIGEQHPAYGLKHSKESIKIRSKKLSKTIKQKGGYFGERNPMFNKKHTDEVKNTIRKKLKDRGGYKGNKNPNAKTFIIESPDGKKYEINGGLKNFCLEHGLSYVSLIKCHQNKINDWRGWKCSLKT